MNDEKIKVLIVDDSDLFRAYINDLLKKDPDIEVVGFAKNGLEGLEKAKLLKPHVILLDIEMPVMNGIECLKRLGKQGNYGIIIVSGFKREVIKATIEGLELGAFDFIYKTANFLNIRANEIIAKIKMAYMTIKKTQLFGRTGTKKQYEGDVSIATEKNGLKYIIALGVSTGGPKALATILPEFPEDLPASIIIVQHMPPKFTSSLASRLNEISRMEVKEAEQGDQLKAGYVYIAPGDYHLTFGNNEKGLYINLDQSPPVRGFRPNVDVMMTSLANIEGFNNIIGVIMTGMGNDGSKGLLELKKKKAETFIIAQDEDTSTVFGMPKAAIELGIVDKTLPLNEIPACIMNFMGVHQ